MDRFEAKLLKLIFKAGTSNLLNFMFFGIREYLKS